MSKILKDRVDYILKKPSIKEHRKGWSLLQRTKTPGGTVNTKKLHSDALEAVNRAYANQSQTEELCQRQAEDIRDRLYRVDRTPVLNQANFDTLGEMENPAPGTYWYEVYGRKKRIVDRRSSYYDLRRAVEAVGNLSLLTASERDLQDAVDGHNWSERKQRRVITRLQPILEWLGRKDVVLEKARPSYPEVDFVNEKELLLLLGALPVLDQHSLQNLVTAEDGAQYLHAAKALCGMAFYSGLRQGELFALEPNHVTEGAVQVYKQLAKDHKTNEYKLREVKTRVPHRTAFLIPGGEQYFKAWFQVPLEERLALRKAEWAKIVGKAAFESMKKPLCFHDLRHSYAIWLVSKGVSLGLVAQSLGNSIKVCEDYYSGRVLKQESVQMIAATVQESTRVLQDAKSPEQPTPSSPSLPREATRKT